MTLITGKGCIFMISSRVTLKLINCARYKITILTRVTYFFVKIFNVSCKRPKIVCGKFALVTHKMLGTIVSQLVNFQQCFRLGHVITFITGEGYSKVNSITVIRNLGLQAD